MYDKIYSLTWKKTISYVGHSQGTSQMFSALSHNKNNFRDKISAFAALAPVVSFKYQDTKNQKAGLDVLYETVERITNIHHIYEVGPSIGNLPEMIPAL